MGISFDRFIEWAESRFEKVKIKNNEIKVNSPFYEEANGEMDRKCKLWCNPSGGKKGLENGVFHCWRTGKKGNLISLVMLVDNCSFEDAIAKLGIDDLSMAEIEAKLEKFFEEKEEQKTLEEKIVDFQLPPYTFLISDLPLGNFNRIAAANYLSKRKLSVDGLYICIADEPPKYKGYRNRIIIPYYNSTGKLIYYNARLMHDENSAGKYMGPPEGTNVLKGDVIYMPKWPPAGSLVYYTEGEIDAISITKTGLFAGAFGGKAVSDTQAEYMRPYRLVLCLDNDKAGIDALPIIGDSLLRRGISFFHYVFPPSNLKDWNSFLQKYGEKILAAYLSQNHNIYDSETSLRFKL